MYSQIQENSIDISKEEGFIDDGPKDTSTDQEETNQSGENVNPTIPLKNMHLIYWAGLRGAVSYSCANIFPDLLGSRYYDLNIFNIIV